MDNTVPDYFWKIADVDLDTGAYHFIRRTDEPDYVMTPRPKTIAEYADRYIRYGVIHPDDVSLYKFVSVMQEIGSEYLNECIIYNIHCIFSCTCMTDTNL